MTKYIISYLSLVLFENISLVLGFLSNMNISYFWFFNGTNYGSSNDSSYEKALTEPSLTLVEAFVYAYVPNKLSNLQALKIMENNASYEYFKNYTPMNSSLTSISTTRFNKFSTNVDARTPMTSIKHTGMKKFRVGEIIEIFLYRFKLIA